MNGSQCVLYLIRIEFDEKYHLKHGFQTDCIIHLEDAHIRAHNIEVHAHVIKILTVKEGF